MAGGTNNVAQMSPRQRMINLMYIVLTAMLALNVSSDVLNGFSIVHESLSQTNRQTSTKNELQFQYLADLYAQEPRLAPWYEKGLKVYNSSNQLYLAIDTLKMEIARAADGSKADFNKLKNLDDLEAASSVMLNPATERGRHLREKIDSYSKLVTSMIPDSARRATVSSMLSTAVAPVPGTVGPTSWEQKLFDGMPAIAAITILTKIQGDVRQAQSEAMSSIITSITMSEDAKNMNIDLDALKDFADISLNDFKVNKFEALVIPNSNVVMQGSKYSARIVVANIDTQDTPSIFVGGSNIKNGLYEFTANSLGTHEYSGYATVRRIDGTTEKFPFKSSYTVVEPMVTISPTMMNVIYAGIDNPFSISVPGVPMDKINASISSGSLTRSGNKWVAKCSNIGSEVTISVTATIDGRQTNVGSMKFRVRKLPDPAPYMTLADGNHYKGAPKRISKANLLNCKSVGAALDDGILDIPYTVVSFSTVFIDQMGNAMPENSAGANFSDRQKAKFEQLKPGSTFFITNVKAKGPDGITRDISPIQVQLN